MSDAERCNGCVLSQSAASQSFEVCQACKESYCSDCEPLLGGLEQFCSHCRDWSREIEEAANEADE